MRRAVKNRIKCVCFIDVTLVSTSAGNLHRRTETILIVRSNAEEPIVLRAIGNKFVDVADVDNMLPEVAGCITVHDFVAGRIGFGA